MKRLFIVAALFVCPAVLHAQQPATSREALERALQEMRGWQEEFLPALPTRPWPSAPIPSRQEELGTVSVASLAHRPPRAARKAYERGLKHSSKGDSMKAAREFEAAIARDPLFAEAHADLGVEYTRLDRLPEAESQMRRAIELDPNVSIWHSNLAWLLFHLRRLPEAEAAARRSLSAGPNNERAHLLLGILLASAPDTRAEGIRHLERASEAFPEVTRITESLP